MASRGCFGIHLASGDMSHYVFVIHFNVWREFVTLLFHCAFNGISAFTTLRENTIARHR